MPRRFYTGLFMALAASSFVAFGLSQAASAQENQRVRVRGTVESFSGDTLVVKTREGSDATIALTSGWKVAGIRNASVDDIKVGDFVGVASLPKGTGPDGAIEVLIFPAAMKGTGEGSYPWDLQPGSTMTNATVANAVADVHGRSLTLTYRGGQKTVTIGQGTPVVTFAPATPDDLKPGATVFVPAEAGPGPALSAGFVVVGTHGVAPPM